MKKKPNFNIIENPVPDWHNFYYELKKDYLETDLTNAQLSEKYDISATRLRKLAIQIREEEGIQKRPCKKRKLPKYISKKGGSYAIIKKYKNKSYYFGRYETLEQAIKARDIFININWDYNKRWEVQREVTA